MKAGWSARLVGRQIDHSDCVVWRCWDQWIREMSSPRRPGSRRPRQTIRGEGRHIVKNARVQPTTSSAAIQVQCAAIDAHQSVPPFGVMPFTRKLDCRGMDPDRL
ncbi:transposable element Tcb2 transposase [Trichonephila clavipes]|uniref:Transposable element Tcb2 transposase n=1 Tax=Trichonephila clavipes TaxID=2585209 RepID=A0A8X6UVN2_TRICX|nr:transposable element Tcb2 transposase [Trichonephila clavipes]